MFRQAMKKTILISALCIMLLCLSAVGVSAALQGDVNFDGKLTAADARLALRISARLEMVDDATYLRADADNNGRVTSFDARLILRVSAGVGSFDDSDRPIVETTNNACCPEDNTDVNDNVCGGIPERPTHPAIDEPTTTEIILMEDMLGSPVGEYEEKFGLVQCLDGQRNMYEGEDITVTLSGTSFPKSDLIESVTTTRRDISVSGIIVGLTVGQTENHLFNREYHIETVDERYSCLIFGYEDYRIQVFFDNGISSMISGGKVNPVNYSADKLIDMPPDVVFGGCATYGDVSENEDGTVDYKYIGLTATACMKNEGMAVDRIVLEGKSDYNIGLVYIGMNVNCLYDIAEESGFTITDNSGGIYLLSHKKYTAEVVTEDGLIVRMEFLSNNRPFVYGQAEDLSSIMGKALGEFTLSSEKQPEVSEDDSNIWFFDGFYLTSEGCMSSTPDRICAVSVCDDGYGFAGIEFGMPVDMLTDFLDGKAVNYLYDAESGILRIASGEYGDYSYLITVNNGFVDWIEVSAGTFDRLYALNFLLMSTIDTVSGPFSRLEMTEADGGMKLSHDCAEFFLTQKDDRYILTGAVITEQCDFNVFGFTVGDDSVMIENELMNNGFSQFDIISDGFSARNSLYEIRIYENDGIAERIELIAL